MAKISCSECGKGISDKALVCPACGAPLTAAQASTGFQACDKERFDLGIAMMQAYYDAIETRLAVPWLFMW